MEQQSLSVRCLSKLPSTACLLIAISCAICLLTLVLEPISASVVLNQMRFHPILFLLNWVPVILTLILFTALFQNSFVAGGLTALLVCGISLIDRVKVQLRYEPLYPRDIRLIREALHAVWNYHLQPEPLIILVFAFTVFGLIGLGIWLNRYCASYSVITRICAAILSLGCLVLLTLTIYRSDDLYGSFPISNLYNHVTVYHELGTPYSFLHSFTCYPVERPEGYSTAEAKAWDGAESESADGKPVHVIIVMNEAFSALTELTVFSYDASSDPLTNFHRLQQDAHSISGKAVVADLGGGTANTEFDVLTGMQADALSPSTSIAFGAVGRNLDSLFRVFSEDHYATSFLHPGVSWFYARKTTYEKLGADVQIYEEDMTDIRRKGGWVSDAFMADYIESHFDQLASAGVMDFSYITTFQNHMTYSSEKYGSEVEIPAVEVNVPLSEEAREQLSVYIEGIRDADAMLGELADYFAGRDEPVLLLFFGDHMPSLGTDQSIYGELSIDLDPIATDPEIAFYPYATPFLIWGNDACTSVLDWDTAVEALELPENGYLSACFLGQIILELTGRGRESAWTEFLGRLRRQLPVVHKGTYMTMDGTVTFVPDSDQAALLEQWRKWTYYKMKHKVIP